MIANRFNPLGVTPAMHYIRDGLIAMWDGIENAGWGKHDWNATTWRDLSGFFEGVDLPIGEHIIEADCVRCDTSTHMRVARPSAFFDLTKDGYTAEIVTTLPPSPNSEMSENALFGAGFGQTPLFFPRSDLISSGWNNGYGGVGTSKAWSETYISVNAAGLKTFNNAKFSFSCASDIVNQKTGRFFNSKKVSSLASAAMVGNSTPSLVGIAINGSGRSNYTASIGNGTRYHCVRWYSRVLSEEEIAHNYAIDKARFGL